MSSTYFEDCLRRLPKWSSGRVEIYLRRRACKLLKLFLGCPSLRNALSGENRLKCCLTVRRLGGSTVFHSHFHLPWPVLASYCLARPCLPRRAPDWPLRAGENDLSGPQGIACLAYGCQMHAGLCYETDYICVRIVYRERERERRSIVYSRRALG